MRQDGFRRVCVVGAGAIGSLIAAHLSRQLPVVVLTRREEHARALTDNGLRVSGLHTFTTRLAATASAAELPEFDLCFLATKATAIDEAAAALEGRAPGATMVTVQNGVGAEALVRAHGDWRIVAGTTLMGGSRHGDTGVAYELAAPTWLGPYEGTPLALVEAVAALLERSGLKAQAFPDLRPAQWTKLVFNAAVGTISAVSGLPHSAAYTDDARLGALVRAAIKEGEQVAAAAGIDLHDDPWELNVRAVGSDEEFSHAPSILLDVRAQLPTEGDFNIGVIVREGERLGVSTPVSTMLLRLLKGKEASYS